MLNGIYQYKGPQVDLKGRKVFVIEDEADIAELIRFNLQLEGFDVTVFNSGEVGLAAVRSESPDLVLLDLMLPGLDGLSICQKMKAETQLKSIPIIMVTAKGEEGDIVKGLELGADDYVTKPFSPKILLARVKTVLRRQPKEPVEDGEAVVFEELMIHPGRHEVKVKGQLVDLTHSEFQILYYLAKRPGWVFTRAQIVDAVHGDNYPVTDRSIDFQMVGLRKKMGDLGHLIETVRGVGYRFKEQV